VIPEETKQQIFSTADLYDVAKDIFTLHKSGKSWFTKCPNCGAEGKTKGLSIDQQKQIFKCFSCDLGGHGAVDFLIKVRKLNYPEALKFLADKYHIFIDEKPKAKGPQKKGRPAIETFRDKQLKSSAIAEADQ
jgi:DNA primase